MTDTFLQQAVILAAGRGTRMGALTHEIPKPMLLIHGRPMLEHILDGLTMAGFRKFFVIVGYRHELIENYFRHSNVDMEFCVQDPLNGTGSAALLAKDFTHGEPFLLTYADILCDAAEYVSCGLQLHRNETAAAVVAVKAVDDPWQGAAVYETGGRIREIIEKPPKGTSTTGWNSAGFYAFRPVLFEYLQRLGPSARNEYELTSALDMMLEDGLNLRISPIQGGWRDVGRPDDLSEANRLS